MIRPRELAACKTQQALRGPALGVPALRSAPGGAIGHRARRGDRAGFVHEIDQQAFFTGWGGVSAVHATAARSGQQYVEKRGYRRRTAWPCCHLRDHRLRAGKSTLKLHDGHSTYLVPGQRCFVTPEAIQATTLVGSPEEICGRLRAAERVGLRELTVLPPSDTRREMLKAFAEQIMHRY